MNHSIFITYNANSQVEESTSLRLQTISNLYGLHILLPYRNRISEQASTETKIRINNSSFVVAFCLEGLTKLIRNELKYAIEQNKPLIIIYDVKNGKKINFDKYNNVKEVYVDFTKTDDALHSVAEFLRTNVSSISKGRISQKRKNEESGLGIALLGIGLGLLAAWSLSKDK